MCSGLCLPSGSTVVVAVIRGVSALCNNFQTVDYYHVGLHHHHHRHRYHRLYNCSDYTRRTSPYYNFAEVAKLSEIDNVLK